MPTIDLGSVVGPQGQQGNTGPQGEQGIAGPSLISASTQTTLTGVLAGDGSTVGVRAVDATPTNNSTNLVSSGGVYNKITNDVAASYQRTCNPNLLDNWYFLNPVNQRGITSYTSTSAYQFDRWKGGAQAGTTTLTASGVSITTPSGASSKRLIEQVTELKSDDVAGMKATLSVLTTSGLYTATDTLIVTSTSANRISLDLDNVGSLAIVNTQSGRGINVNIRAGVGITLTVIAVKLELGNTQTLAHNEETDENPVWVLNEIPNYATELLKCQQYLFLLPRYNSIRATAVRSDDVYFSIPIPVPLAKQPTLINGSYLSIQLLTGSAVSGFTFSVTQYAGNYIQIDSSKTAHGLSDAVLSYGNTAPGVFISAEI